MTGYQRFGRVAVLMGGTSAERDISLKSGRAVLDGLRGLGVDAHGIDVDRQILQTLLAGGYDRVFNVLHGRGGEDGVMQGVLELMGLPYTGTGVLGSALAMDKLRSKQIWLAAGLPTPPWRPVSSLADCHSAADQLGLPVMIKPQLEGSSIGITKVDHREMLAEAFRQARAFGPVMAERYVAGNEYTISILQDTALPTIRLETPRVFYDYEAKYFSDQTLYHCPAGLSAAEEDELQTLSLAAFGAVGAAGWGRVDLMIDEAGPWLIEVNTIPGMTDHSLVPMAARAAGLEFDELVLRILATSLDESERDLGSPL